MEDRASNGSITPEFNEHNCRRSKHYLIAISYDGKRNGGGRYQRGERRNGRGGGGCGETERVLRPHPREPARCAKGGRDRGAVPTGPNNHGDGRGGVGPAEAGSHRRRGEGKPAQPRRSEKMHFSNGSSNGLISLA